MPPNSTSSIGPEVPRQAEPILGRSKRGWQSGTKDVANSPSTQPGRHRAWPRSRTILSSRL